jgi:Na+/citrate or Na+/malate symporter
MEINLTSMSAIIVICYLVGAFVKALVPSIKNDFIPVICGTVGGILSAILHIFILHSPSDDLLMNIAYGIIAGLTATGVKEITKIREILSNGKSK